MKEENRLPYETRFHCGKEGDARELIRIRNLLCRRLFVTNEECAGVVIRIGASE